MESWQKTYIRKHLHSFIEETTANTKIIAFLMAADVLCDVDVQKLKATGDREGDSSKTQALYNLLFKRKNGYKAIGRATFESRQSGAFFLLLKGLVKHLLQQSNIDLKEETIDEILQAECLTADVWQFFNAKLDKGTLYEDNWIAASHPFYIPRHMSNRIKLKPEVIQHKCSDILVFTRITRSELSKLAAPNRTALSSQIISKNMTTIRFVLLEHEHHWEKLRSVWSDTPIHLIQFESESSDYILLNSTQVSEVVSNHVPPHLRDKSLYVPEEQFLTEISNEEKQRTVCICDTPGMGKTLLLENLARQRQQLHDSGMIAVIGLQKFVEQTQASRQNFIISDNPIQILMNYLCPLRLTSTLLKKALENNQIQLELFLDGFDEVTKEQVQTTQDFFKSVTKNQPNVKLFITSRPHMRGELERTFEGVAYDILPFSEENQTEFLVRFWQTFAERPKELNLEKLRLFARECLNCFKKSLTKEEGELMGIPLQCLLLATVNLTNAEMYCHGDSTLDIAEFISPTSLHDMYTIYFERGIDRAVRILGQINYEAPTSRNENSAIERLFWWAIGKLNPVRSRSALTCKDRQKLKAYHVWVALQLLFPDLAENYRRRESIPDIDSETILACGILQNCSTVKVSPAAMAFIHRTFAEYLVAEHFAEIITSCCKSMNNGMLTKYIGYFVTDILSTQSYYPRFGNNSIDKSKLLFKFSNSAVVYFLNASLQSNIEISSSNILSRNLLQYLSAQNFPLILKACITSSYSNIIRLFKNLLKPIANEISSENMTLRRLIVSSGFEGPIDEFSPFVDEYYLNVHDYLYQTAEMSNVNVLEELYSFFQECLNENLNELCSKMPEDVYTPLGLAVERLDYSMVEYFASQITLPGRRILFSFPEYSNHDSQEAIEICKLLIANESSIIFEKIKDKLYKTSSIIHHFPDVELIKFLVQLGADVRDTRIYRNDDDDQHHENHRIDTVLTLNLERMDEYDFCELCRYLLHDIEAYDLFTPNLPLWDDPLPKIISRIDDDILTSILEIPGVKINGNNLDGNNLVLASIEGNRKLSTVKRLVDLGVDALAKNKRGKNALHVAICSGNAETTKYVLSLGFSLDTMDHNLNTTLHYAAGNIEMLKFLILHNSNILAVNHRGDNIAHLALSDQNITNKTAVVLYLLSLGEGKELFTTTNYRGRTPLHELIANEDSSPDSETVELILQATGEDVNATDLDGWTMFLHAAEKRDSVAYLKCLKKFGADHNVTTSDGWNALHCSAEKGFLESTKYLVSIGVSLEVKDYQGKTPLLLSSRNTDKRVMKYLISQHANELAVDHDGNSFAHLVRRLMHDDIMNSSDISTVEYLMTLPLATQIFKITNKNGRTPLHEWIANWNFDSNSKTMELILQKFEEEVNATDSYGLTMFLHAASMKDSVECMKSLKKFGANHNVTDAYGNSALHISAEYGFHESTKYLVSIGLSLELQNYWGNTPLLVSSRRGDVNVIKYLISHHANVLAVNHKGDNFAHQLFIEHINEKNLKPIVEYLLSLPQAAPLFEMINQIGRTPLNEWIAREDSSPDSNTMELILQKSGENVNASDSDGWTMFLHAANKEDSVDGLKSLKKVGANINVTTSDGISALHMSAEMGCLESTMYLVSIGLCLELQDNHGNTPLLVSSRRGDVNVIKYLISHQANVLAVNHEGNSLAHLLVQIINNNNILKPIVEYLLTLPQALQLFNIKNKKGRTPQHEWVANGDSNPESETMELIHQTSREDVNATDSDGWTMFLHAASKEDSVECMKSLKKFGANHNVTTTDQCNALHISVNRRFHESTKYLVSIGVHLEQQNFYGHTPLHLSLAWRDVNEMKFFISENANVLAVDNDGDSIAHILFQNILDNSTLKPTVEYLLALPQSLQLFNIMNKKGRTPQHEWVANRDSNPESETMELIHQTSGEDVNATDSDGWTMFLHAASKDDSVECMKSLKKFGANHNVTTSEGWNALHCSAEKGFLESTKYLVSIGVSLEVQNNQGNTPLMVSSRQGDIIVIKYLISRHANVLAVDHDGNSIAHLLFSGNIHKSFKPIVEYFLSLPQAPELFKMTNHNDETPLQVWLKSDELIPDPELKERLLKISVDKRCLSSPF